MTENAEQHIELYKKYRPKTWKGLVGEQKVAKSLQSAVLNGKLPTAYLFSGPRGCGKTSAALLLAKAINCLDLQDNADPCNKCEVCVDIDNGRQLGVNYISAANKGKVDDVREYVQQARLRQPVKRQVWILDEIHRTSKEGFDALLIPLEEANMPSIFILCTTEIEKVPQTIKSRVQSRRFNLVDSDLMLKYISHIASKEELEVTDEQLKDAVRLGKGSVRDTLTSLEGLVATGEEYSSYVGELTEAFASHDLAKVLETIASASSNSTDSLDLAEQLFEELRNLLLYASNVDSSLIGIISVKDEKEAIRGLFGKRGIALVMNEIADAITRMSFGADRRISLEIATIKGMEKLRALSKAKAS